MLSLDHLLKTLQWFLRVRIKAKMCLLCPASLSLWFLLPLLLLVPFWFQKLPLFSPALGLLHMIFSLSLKALLMCLHLQTSICLSLNIGCSQNTFQDPPKGSHTLVGSPSITLLFHSTCHSYDVTFLQLYKSVMILLISSSSHSL